MKQTIDKNAHWVPIPKSEFEQKLADERKHIGFLHPVSDTRYRNENTVLVKYLFTVQDDDEIEGWESPEIAIGKFIYDHEDPFDDSSPEKYMLFTGICDVEENPYFACPEDNIIGWLFLNELNEILTNDEEQDRKLHELLRAKLDYDEKNKQFTPKKPQ